MTGQVVFRPDQDHACSPGWTYSIAQGGGPIGPPAGTQIAHPPSAYDYPAGTVWECECGQTWISTGPPPPRNGHYAPGMTEFRLERRSEKRRRLRGVS